MEVPSGEEAASTLLTYLGMASRGDHSAAHEALGIDAAALDSVLSGAGVRSLGSEVYDHMRAVLRCALAAAFVATSAALQLRAWTLLAPSRLVWCVGRYWDCL